MTNVSSFMTNLGRRTEWLTQFREGGCDLLVLPPITPLSFPVHLGAARTGVLKSRVTPASAERVVGELAAKLNLMNSYLVEAMRHTTVLFLSAFSRRAADLRLEVIDRQSCPKFHQDSVHVRLLVTYAGPGTEYVSLDSPEQASQAPVGSIVLMKGSKHPTNAGTILHRSPPVAAGERRLCLVLDY